MTFITPPCLNLCMYSSKHKTRVIRGDVSMINKYFNLRLDNNDHTHARITINNNLQIVYDNILKSEKDECVQNSIGA